VILKTGPFPRYRLTVSYEEAWVDYVGVLRKGTLLTITGEIVAVTQSGVVLDKCQPRLLPPYQQTVYP
jgi:hypothetical protein